MFDKHILHRVFSFFGQKLSKYISSLIPCSNFICNVFFASNRPQIINHKFQVFILTRIIITGQVDPSFVQKIIDYSFVDRVSLSKDCREISNDTLKTQLHSLTKNHNYHGNFFSINLEYNEDDGVFIKAFHVITLNTSDETRIQINDNKPRRYNQFNMQWIKIRRALGIKEVPGRMIDLIKKNCLVHCATNNSIIIIGDGKARGHKIITEKIIVLDQLIIPVSQMTKIEAASEGWITLGKKM